MRLLHTSDWHLGRAFHGASMQSEQESMIDVVVEMAADQRVDVVVVAGDLYDRAIPPLESIALFEDAIARLRATGARVVAISGNHDSPRRVSTHEGLLEEAGVTIRGDARRATSPVMVRPADGGPAVAVYAVPYLDPPSNAATFDPAAADRQARPTHDSVTRAAMAQIRQDLATRGNPRSVVVAHTFVTGGAPSDSERDLSIGNVEYVALDAFEGFDYVALGHLHGPQAFAAGRVAYSGSPLPYSFSEERHHKSVRVVELAPAGGGTTFEQLPFRVGMPLRSIRGRLTELLTDAALTDAESARVRCVLTDPELPHQAMVRLRRRFPHTVELRHEPNGRPLEPTAMAIRERRREAPPAELVASFWKDQHGATPTEAEHALLQAAVRAQVERVPS